MKVTKAIEILKDIITTGEYEGDPDDSDAIILGAEALKRHQECKDRTRKGMLMPLPGETTEE